MRINHRIQLPENKTNTAVWSDEIIVQMKGVSKSFQLNTNGKKDTFTALSDVSFEIKAGSFVSFAGPSGCGKSTLINLIAGFEKPDCGEVLFKNAPIPGPSPQRLVIFQEHGLFPWASVQKNVEFGMKCAGVDKKTRREKAEYFMRMVHLSKFKDSFPSQLSGGMRQRAALARALALEPSILLMDEPFSALDHRSRDLLHLEIEKIRLETKMTMLLVSHSIEEALRLSDFIFVMSSNPGRIRRVINVDLPRPRDFFDMRLTYLRAQILSELEDEMNILIRKEGYGDWNFKKDSLRGRRDLSLGGDLGPDIRTGA